MIVRVRLFAAYRETVGAGALELELDDAATVADAWRALSGEHPQLGDAPALAARNRTRVPLDATLADGDEVAFLPPVGGG